MGSNSGANSADISAPPGVKNNNNCALKMCMRILPADLPADMTTANMHWLCPACTLQRRLARPAVSPAVARKLCSHGASVGAAAVPV